ncbi:hypothetical protein TrRE_jg8782 [Triparma retinervis]|uniref:Uncharacterized protein n=1 Tax=Triparma retinervis TaxID=2557542 RepID=A0A9W6ZX60_9STRA|nr:hypothetical protein TrRE_jg8782 [Triparma retinervis]
MQSTERKPGDFRGSIGSRPNAVYSAVSTSMDGIGSSFEPSPSPSSALGYVREEGIVGVGGGMTPVDTIVGASGSSGPRDAGKGGLTPSLQKREVVAVKSSNGTDNKVLESALKNSMEGSKKKKKKKKKKTTTINEASNETFRPSSEAYTPKLPRKVAQTTAADPKKLSNKPDVLGKYKEVGKRDDKAIANMGSLGRVNFKDALKRVAMVVHQHVVKIERRYSTRSKENENSGLFHTNKLSLFCESNYATPSYHHTTVRVPTLPGGAFFVAKPVKKTFAVPETSEIYDFMYQLFRKVQLSSECSVVCLIYVERLMERGNFATVYPQFSLSCINALEHTFLSEVKWDLYISSSLYAKYYFALRSLLEKKDFRQKYMRMVQVEAPDAGRIQERSGKIKEEALMQLSRSV